MQRWTVPLASAALVAAVACRHPVDTIPPVVSPAAAVQYYDLEVPRDLAIESVSFSPTTYASVYGPSGGPTTSSASGRAFVGVHAVRRATGEHFLLLYEDVARRRRPVQIIRFVPGTDPARPDSTGGTSN